MLSCLHILLVSLLLNGLRWDLTADRRYTISPVTDSLVEQLDAPMQVQVLLEGKQMNVGFQRLNQATMDLLDELENRNGNCRVISGEIPTNLDLQPIVVHERSRDGQMVQTPVYPYAVLKYKGRLRVVNLLQNTLGKSGEENLNSSIESLEYRFAEAINGLLQTQTDRVAFLEGHGELTEREVYDWSKELSRYFQVDRGVLGTDVTVLDAYKAVIIAGPSEALSDTDKFIIDQYIMRGGRVMWLLDGVRFSENMLQSNGLTPVIAEDWNTRDMLFRYGIRINPVLVQDLQCKMVPVEVSGSRTEGQFQPMPWTFAPLLLTSEESPITKNIAQVSGVMMGEVEAVGGEDGIDKQVLLATSDASRKIGVPAEVDLTDLTVHPEYFQLQYIPVAVSLEGVFPSFFTHRLSPLGNSTPTLTQSEKTKQVVVAGSQIAVNEWQQNEPLPVGFDRYMKTQFGNRDFLTNSILWLTDEHGLMALRNKHVQLRLLNDRRSYQLRQTIQIISLVAPIAILALTGGVVITVRRKKYQR